MRLLFITLLLSFASNAMEEFRPEGPSYIVHESEFDKKLKKNESQFIIDVKWNRLDVKVKEVVYADNGDMETIELKKDPNFCFKTTPGKHVLEFSIGPDHFEIRTDSIEIKAQHKTKITLHFKYSREQLQVRKPVIYLYPEKETEVTVKVDPVGEMIFTYPKYDEAWEITASPNGELTFEDKSYNYLFWESEQNVPTEKIDYSQGEIVHAGDLTVYLEMMLSTYGLTPQEQADFITYWVPQMQDANYLYIYLLFDEECDAFAELSIHPKPDQIGRLYMLWDKVEDDRGIELELRDIPELNREGFTVIEWGGAQIDFKRRQDI